MEKQDKEKDLKFIKDFSGLQLKDILESVNVDRSNLYKGKISAEKMKLVRKEIDKRIIKLYYERENYEG